MSLLDKGISATFDFGLIDVPEARASRLHRESIVFDLLSQGTGGNIFKYYPTELLADFEAKVAGVSGLDGLMIATYWPYEMSKLCKSDLIRDWFYASGMTCGTYALDVHDG